MSVRDTLVLHADWTIISLWFLTEPGDPFRTQMVTERTAKYRVFMSAAEPSGDSHCAALINALEKRGYDLEFVGVGGPKMASAGCRLLEKTTVRAAMTYEAFRHVPHFYGLIRRIRRFFEGNKTDLVIVCDSPAFNFHVAKAAKKSDINTVFYVAPQLWAWAPWRIRKLRKYCDKLCCILPFEQEWFSQRGVDTVFVGSPLLEGLAADLSVYRKTYADFDPAKVILALLPGSRAAEIDSLWIPMQQIALQIKQKYPGASFITVAVDEQRKQILQSRQAEGFECDYTIGTVSDTARRADFALVASGSATLQVAAVGCPMVVMYRCNRVLWHLLGRWLVKIRLLSLVNVLAGEQLVPEFMPYFNSTLPIAETVENLLKHKEKLVRLSGGLVDLAQPLRKENASETVARVACDMLD